MTVIINVLMNKLMKYNSKSIIIITVMEVKEI